jgi:hypothetical protein
MSCSMYSPCTVPVQPRPDPVQLFIQQALLTLVYREHSSATNSDRKDVARVAV